MKILIAEDEEINQTLLSGILAPLEQTITVVRTGQEALDLLQNQGFDVLLFDVMMPDLDGMALTRICRKDPRFKDIPILLITALSSQTDLLAGFEAGASDYILKPFHATELLYRIKSQLQMRNLQLLMEKSVNDLNLQMLQIEQQKHELEAKDRALAEANRRLLELASRDSLTGLLNRRKGWDFMDYEQERAKRSLKSIGVAMLDLDKFKAINDGLGHDAGDLVLKTASACLTACLRSSDILIRWGGEEFLAVFPEVQAPELALAAEKIRLAIQEYPWALAQSPAVTVSIGTTLKTPDTTWDCALELADKALYQAKEKGRNRVEFLA